LIFQFLSLEGHGALQGREGKGEGGNSETPLPSIPSRKGRGNYFGDSI